MRHRVKKARLGRPADQRKALLRGLVTDVLKYGAITTTKVSFCFSCACVAFCPFNAMLTRI
jgi:hypothetical protein